MGAKSPLCGSGVGASWGACRGSAAAPGVNAGVSCGAGLSCGADNGLGDGYCDDRATEAMEVKPAGRALMTPPLPPDANLRTLGCIEAAGETSLPSASELVRLDWIAVPRLAAARRAGGEDEGSVSREALNLAMLQTIADVESTSSETLKKGRRFSRTLFSICSLIKVLGTHPTMSLNFFL